MLDRWRIWLFTDPRHVWLALVPTVIALVYALGIGKSEDAIRLTGLVLQLAGILTVIWGLVATWRFFGLGDPVQRIKDWWGRRPWKRRTIYVSIGEAVEANDTLSARAHTSWPLDPNASIAARVEAIEKNLPLIQERISQTQRELDAAVSALRGEFQEGIAAAVAKVATVDSRVVGLGTGSLHISAIGALWLFVGSILGGASSNIAEWLR